MFLFLIIENSKKIKQIFQHYDISTHSTPISTLMNAIVYLKDGGESRQGILYRKISCNIDFACQKAYIGETLQPLQYRLKHHNQSSYNENDSAVYKHVILSEHQIDVNYATISDGEKAGLNVV